MRRRTQKDVGTIYLQVTYDADVLTASHKTNLRLDTQIVSQKYAEFVHRTFRVHANSFLNKLVRDTYDSIMT